MPEGEYFLLFSINKCTHKINETLPVNNVDIFFSKMKHAKRKLTNRLKEDHLDVRLRLVTSCCLILTCCLILIKTANVNHTVFWNRKCIVL